MLSLATWLTCFFLTLGRPLVRVDLRAVRMPAARVSESVASDTPYARHWQVGRHGVIGFQHRRKINPILFPNTLAPTVIRTVPRNYLVIEGVKSQKTRSCYEYRPLGRSKKVRAAVGSQICEPGAGALVRKERV
jgi:hypothetical protein